MAWIIHGILANGAIIALVCVAAFVLFGIFMKCLNKQNLRTCGMVSLCALLCLYFIFCAGEYRKLKVDNDTKERLLSINISDSDLSGYAKNKYDDYIVYELDDISNAHGVSVTIGKGDREDIYINNAIEKVFDNEFSDADSLVYIAPRVSDRDLGQLPVVQGYFAEITLIQNSGMMVISYWSDQNDCQILNEVLDRICP